MALESEIHRKKGEKEIRFTNKYVVTVISLAIGLAVGLSISLLSYVAHTAPVLSSYSTAETTDVVAVCKDGVFKYAPLGAYPGGQEHVKSALRYCDSLS
jgi:hypothetical protein